MCSLELGKVDLLVPFLLLLYPKPNTCKENSFIYLTIMEAPDINLALVRTSWQGHEKERERDRGGWEELKLHHQTRSQSRRSGVTIHLVAIHSLKIWLRGPLRTSLILSEVVPQWSRDLPLFPPLKCSTTYQHCHSRDQDSSTWTLRGHTQIMF